MRELQRIGGLAALIHALALVIGMVIGIAVIFPILGAEPGQYLAFLSERQLLFFGWNLIAYWGTAATLVVMALALYDRLKTGAPALAQTATAFGLIWAALIIGSGNLMLRNIGIVAELYGKDPAQAATVWLALDAVETGIVSGNELVGSLWLLLLCLAAVRTNGLPRALSYLGVAVSTAGIITLVPGLAETLGLIFGLGVIVWSIWVGIVMLRPLADAAAPTPTTFGPRQATPGGAGGMR